MIYTHYYVDISLNIKDTLAVLHRPKGANRRKEQVRMLEYHIKGEYNNNRRQMEAGMLWERGWGG